MRNRHAGQLAERQHCVWEPSSCCSSHHGLPCRHKVVRGVTKKAHRAVEALVPDVTSVASAPSRPQEEASTRGAESAPGMERDAGAVTVEEAP